MKSVTKEQVEELRNQGYGLMEAHSMLKKQNAREALLNARMLWDCNEPDQAFRELLDVVEYLLK